MLAAAPRCARVVPMKICLPPLPPPPLGPTRAVISISRALVLPRLAGIYTRHLTPSAYPSSFMALLPPDEFLPVLSQEETSMLKLWGEDAIIDFPGAKSSIIDERDVFMARAIHAAASGQQGLSPAYVLTDSEQDGGQAGIYRYASHGCVEQSSQRHHGCRAVLDHQSSSPFLPAASAQQCAASIFFAPSRPFHRSPTGPSPASECLWHNSLHLTSPMGLSSHPPSTFPSAPRCLGLC